MSFPLRGRGHSILFLPAAERFDTFFRLHLGEGVRAPNREVGPDGTAASFPNSCLGTRFPETPVSALGRNGVSRTDVPKQEFGNERREIPESIHAPSGKKPIVPPFNFCT